MGRRRWSSVISRSSIDSICALFRCISLQVSLRRRCERCNRAEKDEIRYSQRCAVCSACKQANCPKGARDDATDDCRGSRSAGHSCGRRGGNLHAGLVGWRHGRLQIGQSATMLIQQKCLLKRRQVHSRPRKYSSKEVFGQNFDLLRCYSNRDVFSKIFNGLSEKCQIGSPAISVRAFWSRRPLTRC